ncbi:MAG: efflux RND transporter permease subunit [Gammaproteobacteria bacterium]|nr:efflux RND transporter permease subunit [Gammaproteobacteria bacterium]MBU1492045.1 efflux RND transporter permease subunit [Gammaproteobacteria bacterium]MBU2065951.1 efflux RND transporter permease subunit [Gammaproteobacteria bacterium]MBU2141277.1 efflux RND transporter permease subunit [Gammaproteobacteria bacterium]MBU2215377.1 efflux RND transporter permease subunit [Gammaproteobacteria bacterium]
MTLSDICIRRPVFATVLSLIVVLLGLMAYDRLAVREYPNIDVPIVTVNITYPGASPEIMESQVAQPIEDVLSGIDGLDFVSSISRSENTQITAQFRLGSNADEAANDVRDRLGRVRGLLPDEIDEPIVQKVEADAQPVIWIAFFSERFSAMEITDVLERVIKDRLQTIPGVSEVQVRGARTFSMRIWLDPEKLAAHNLTVQDVEAAIRRQNVEIPAGRIESSDREFTVLSETDLNTPEQFNNLIVDDSRGYLLRLSDIGHAEIAARDERSLVRYRGKPAVSMGMVKQATANPLDISDGLNAALPDIRALLPEGMDMAVANDNSQFIRESIDNVFITIWEAVVLVILIIFLFLRSLRATIIPLVTIPVSLIGAFALMSLMGFTINTLTLLAMVLAIGLVVDDAIVMLENIHRHIEEGMAPRAAALKGSREIAFAVIAMTLTLAAVFAPIGFMQGITGKLFTEFAWTLAGAVLVSGFVALTLTPMMCAVLLKAHVKDEQHGRIYNLIEGFLNGVTYRYRHLLEQALRAWVLMLAVLLATIIACVWLFSGLRSELAPTEDTGTIVGVFNGPDGATIDYTARYAREVEAAYESIAETNRYMVIAGFPTVAQGISFMKLEDWADRSRNQFEIRNELLPKLQDIAGMRVFPVNRPPLGQSARNQPINFVIRSSMEYAELQTYVAQLIEQVRGYPGLESLDSDLKLNTPQLKIEVNREQAVSVGTDVATIGRSLESLFGSRQVTRFKQNGEQYDVLVQLQDIDRRNPQDLDRVYVRAGDGSMVQLSNLISVRETVAPRELNHFNQLRAVTISANVGSGYTLGEALDHLEDAAREVFPPDTQYDYTGTSRDYKESSSGILLIFVLALAFIFLVLAAQFESFTDPLIILFSVPLSMAGALLALTLFGGTLNIYSQIGLVTLIGLITKHGILIVEFANHLQREGVALGQAIVEASVQRLRPILMTTGAMVLGSLPLAIASGAGAESRQQIGLVIVGGLLVGTFFTLFVIPTLYMLLRRWQPIKPYAEDDLAHA